MLTLKSGVPAAVKLLIKYDYIVLGWWLKVLEDDLKRIICLHPEIIEERLFIEQEEYPIETGYTTYRIDLKCRDNANKELFVELKLRAGKNVVYQILKYKVFTEEINNARFMVAALDFDHETKAVLEGSGFETKQIDVRLVNDLLVKEKDNPLLYQRKSDLTDNIFKHSGGFRESVLYSASERAIVQQFMNTLEEIIKDNKIPGFKLQGLDVRGKDQYRLLLESEKYPSDKIIIYNRERVRNQIHLLYVPDFSFSPGRTPKKKEFEKYILHQSNIEDRFDLPMYRAVQRKKPKNRLEITCQAWKGFSKIITRDLDDWVKPDFIEMVSRDLFDFIDNVMPIVDNFYEHRQ